MGRTASATIGTTRPAGPILSRSKLDKRNKRRYIVMGGSRGLIAGFACLRASVVPPSLHCRAGGRLRGREGFLASADCEEVKPGLVGARDSEARRGLAGP